MRVAGAGHDGIRRKYNLTHRQAAFVCEYLIDLNASKAAIRAGYSARTARAQGARLLTKVNVADAIEEKFQERLRRVDVTQDSVIRRLAAIAFTDIDSFVTWEDGKVVITNLSDIPRESLGALIEVSDTLHGLRLKLADRMPALTLLAKHLRLLPLPGSREEPIQHEIHLKEEDIDLSEFTDEKLAQLRETIGAILTAQDIAAGSPGPSC